MTAEKAEAANLSADGPGTPSTHGGRAERTVADAKREWPSLFRERIAFMNRVFGKNFDPYGSSKP